MISVQRILPYTKQLVLYALYDVLDSEESCMMFWIRKKANTTKRKTDGSPPK